MDVTKILEADHRKVQDLFDRIEKADADARKPLIDDLTESLQGHMKLEEAVVYPAMEPVTGHEDVVEGNVEHDLARKALHDVVRLAPDEPGFGAALDSCKAGVKHHVDEEEDDIFPKLRKDGTRVLEAMSTPFMKKRLELGLPVTVGDLTAAANKAELLAEARGAGVEGTSEMTKDELAGALVAQMS